jgi:hypothetical protein
MAEHQKPLGLAIEFEVSSGFLRIVLITLISPIGDIPPSAGAVIFFA